MNSGFVDDEGPLEDNAPVVSSWRTRAIARSIAIFLYAVRATTLQFHVFPKDYRKLAQQYMPFIIASWHGQNHLIPFALPRRERRLIWVLTSTNDDGRLAAEVLRRLGHRVIAGSGAGTDPRRIINKSSLAAGRRILRILNAGNSVAMTADVPNIARVAGLGVVQIARMSGRPIIPIAASSSRHHVLRNWDQTVIDCLFSRRIAVVIGAPITVAPGDDAESKRVEVEIALNRLNAEAADMSHANRQAGSRCALLAVIEKRLAKAKQARSRKRNRDAA